MTLEYIDITHVQTYTHTRTRLVPLCISQRVRPMSYFPRLQGSMTTSVVASKFTDYAIILCTYMHVRVCVHSCVCMLVCSCVSKQVYVSWYDVNCPLYVR